jgi:dTMP kinase
VRGDQPNAFELAESLEKARQIFLDLPAKSSARSIKIDASRPWRDVSKECLHHFQQTAMQKLWKTADPRTISSETLQMFGE